MTKTFCDICGREVGLNQKDHKMLLCSEYLAINDGVEFIYRQVCTKCTRKLRMYIKGLRIGYGVTQDAEEI
jgi:hypothetical protein